MRRLKQIGAATAALLLVAGSLVQAGNFTWNFDTDPTTGTNPLILGGNNPELWRDTEGNPDTGGFLAITYSLGSQNGFALFPDIDEGDLITAFTLSADIRSGNSQTDRGADGWSVSLARTTDPALADPTTVNLGAFAAGLPETGTTTGIAISFDTWSGNALPDGGDIEGLIIRVDNVTVGRFALPTRHGDCDDPTSLQTGPRDPDYWAAGGDPYDPAAWENICWQPLVVELNALGQVSVTWKGTLILDKFQSDFFPSAGRIILAGRTGGSNSNAHFDNVTLVTETIAGDNEPPTAPGFLNLVEAGSGRIALEWGESTDDSGRVAYRLEKNGALLPGTFTALTYEDRSVLPESTTTYRVVATDVAGNLSAFVPATPLSVTTPADVEAVAAARLEIFDGIAGAIPIPDAVLDPIYTSGNFTRVRYLPGLTFGEPAFGDTFGDNYLGRITGTITPLVSGDYRFFVRSDDASEFHLNPSGTTIPDPTLQFPDATETGCCRAFLEPDDAVTEYPTSRPISLTAGTSYGFLFLVKEGGGGDWGQVAWRLEGDTTPAASLPPITGAVLTGRADPIGTTLAITQQPQGVTTVANERVELTAVAEGSTPYNTSIVYQWRKNGTPIAGGTGPTLVFPAVASGDAGTYSVQAFLSGVVATSDDAVLTVNADNVPPTIVSVEQTSDTFDTLLVTFSEPVTAPTATTSSNYELSPSVGVNSAVLSADRFAVTLTTAALSEDTAYTLTVNNVADNAGNAIAPGTEVAFSSWALVPNRAKLEIWDGFPGAAITDMDTVIGDVRFPDSPDRMQYLPGMTWGEPAFGNTLGDNHMAQTKAWVEVPETGQYRFFVRSDDASRLYITTTGDTTVFPNPRTAVPVAQEHGCCAPFEEPGAGANPDGSLPTSAPISLTAGQKYAVVFLVKEGGGGDWGQVAMRMEGDTTPGSDLLPITTYSFYYGPRVSAVPALGFARDGGNIVLTYDGALEEADDVEGPYTRIGGATSPWSVAPSSTMKYYRVVQ